ncbi:hypothetical protein L486_05329 [Kwoniella mangroviensis CBS 10435]|uniref:Uncharacterized protein n=1 Tax=Kwoniella mangroviensis CBS 10435 TaxID=1331196 RepID=A0A1B9IM98_9TREE|nr:uncharacterized protein I203_05459 [Kwoniella mangroviensis CBS 8507]OCF56480.1 hypothetical protein L486_05329 [Kwoniella mangroviensis CBS 10435]OCF65214.1 hypothetical protein I203_05459 [Kwoniella mangroviensis CBS 8507]
MLYRTALAARRSPISLKPIVAARLYATGPNPTTPPSSGPGGPAGSAGTDTQSNNTLLYGGGAVALIGLGYYFFGGGSTNARASQSLKSAEAPLKQAELYSKGAADRAEVKAGELTGKTKGQFEEAKGEVKKAFK